MEQEYWNRFVETGKITDYLNYKGMAICKQVMDCYEGDRHSESDYSDRHSACSDTCW
ncbi:hypothetical protein ACQRBN_06185 [Bariatricus sp. SGI.154]|uniref:hypothetical protein n=1 Tax=Bariatricus sp. SGI.154 TaxID=3420549 RepID=UPI003CFE08BD